MRKGEEMNKMNKMSCGKKKYIYRIFFWIRIMKRRGGKRKQNVSRKGKPWNEKSIREEEEKRRC